MMSKNILCVLLVAVLNFGLSFRTLTVKKSPFVSEKMSSLEMTSKNRNDAQSLFRKFCLTGLATVVSGLSFENQSPSVLVSSPMHMNVAAAQAAAIPAVGADAPAFTLPSNSGKDLSLDDFPGKRIVLYFYPGDFTQGCTIEAQGFQRDLPKYNELGAQIIGVSVDTVDKHLDFGKTYGLGFPLLSDQGGVVSGKYGSLLDFGFIGKFSNRQTYILAPDTHKIEYVFTDVEGRVAQHSQDVLEKLSTLPKIVSAKQTL